MNVPKILTTVTSLSKILTAILFIAFPFVGFYIGLQYQQQFTKYMEDRAMLDQYEIRSSSIDKKTASPSANPDSNTVDWKTYSNVQYAYSIKYPNAWFVSGISHEGGGILMPCSESNTQTNTVLFSKIRLMDCGFVGDTIPNSEAEFTIWVLDSPWEENEILTTDATGTDISEAIVIAGAKATKTPFTEKSELPNIQATRIYFNHSNKGYLIFLKQTDKNGNYDSILDQILSTFKFLNPEE